MKSMRSFTRRTLVVATATALALYVGMIPDDFQWNEGMSAVGLVYAAGPGQRGGGSSHTGGSSHDHDDSSHTDHDDSSHTDHDDSSHDDGHAASGGKRKGGPKYQGGRSASGSTKGRGAGSQAVIEKIFEYE